MKAAVLIAGFCICHAALAEAKPEQWYERPGRNVYVPASDLPDHLGEDNRLWQVGLHRKSFYNMIQVDGDRVYCAMSGNNLPEPLRNRGGLLCLEVETGAVLWQVGLGPIRNAAYGATIIPLIEGDRIYQQVETTCYCLDRDGNILWETDVAQRYMNEVHGTNSCGIIIGDYWWVGTGFSSGSDCNNWLSNSLEHPWHPNIVVLDKRTGRKVAQDEAVLRENQHGQWCGLSTGVVDGKRLVFWGDGWGYVHAFEVPDQFPAQGEITIKEAWRIDANPESYRFMEDGTHLPYAAYMGEFGPRDIGPCEIIGVPVFHEGLLYVTLARDKEYGANRRGRSIGAGAVVCIDPSGPEPRKVWTNTDVNRTFCPPSIVDGLMYLADHSGYVNCLDLKTGERLWQQDINYCMWNYFQSVGDGKIYVMNEVRDFFILKGGREGGRLFHALMNTANNPQAGMTDGILIVGTHGSVAAYGGPEYMKTHQAMDPGVSAQFRLPREDEPSEPPSGH
jgi:outer membrane protein assembly factor BamB